MTKSDIDKEALKPSHSWVESGNGKLGKIYVEVLKCENLPNIMLNQKIYIEKGLTDPVSVNEHVVL